MYSWHTIILPSGNKQGVWCDNGEVAVSLVPLRLRIGNISVDAGAMVVLVSTIIFQQVRWIHITTMFRVDRIYGTVGIVSLCTWYSLVSLFVVACVCVCSGVFNPSHFLLLRILYTTCRMPRYKILYCSITQYFNSLQIRYSRQPVTGIPWFAWMKYNTPNVYPVLDSTRPTWITISFATLADHVVFIGIISGSLASIDWNHTRTSRRVDPDKQY